MAEGAPGNGGLPGNGVRTGSQWAPESSVRSPATGVHQACRCLMRKLESWLSDEEFGDRMITWTVCGYKGRAMSVVVSTLLSEAP
jgi:hypothetical protein